MSVCIAGAHLCTALEITDQQQWPKLDPVHFAPGGMFTEYAWIAARTWASH